MKSTGQRLDSPNTPVPLRMLTALPVFNEAKSVNTVLDCVVSNADDILVVNDGSTDDTAQLLAKRTDIVLHTHDKNRGYGAALRSAFCYARKHNYDVLVTIDCDGQHEPQRIRTLAEACAGYDLVSGSRYRDEQLDTTGVAPADRRRINHTITAELNEQLGLSLTDAFCGFKAYRVASLANLHLSETGYAMPLELWVQAAQLGWRIQEVAVPRIYLDEERSFGGALDNAEERLAYYRETIARALAAARQPVVEEDPLCRQVDTSAFATT
ncbi:glycosyltransferase family 2 protein [Botrimarina hoheduenensis]|uniref:Undecaprenyl-phosphate mannosyltransferase n=1 Tax=Botrimarina hoheduenensis TaxID=2528000 RepID=A0A5C5W9F2_9BACT|nr:glycosyltransferase family 2 protein [Botrimarina hoheduenensis]TWT46659.1 Undecaprenyl-phosphate mannosyltransferase [Botrimarina hoheduenensis]